MTNVFGPGIRFFAVARASLAAFAAHALPIEDLRTAFRQPPAFDLAQLRDLIRKVAEAAPAHDALIERHCSVTSK